MTAGEAHLAELPENPVMAAAAAGAFDICGHADLLALQDSTELRALFHRPDLSGDPTAAASWQDAAALQSLSLSLFHGHGHQQAAVAPSPPSGHHQLPVQPGFHVRRSKYLAPAKELLGEFCGLGGEHDAMNGKRGRASGGGRWEEVEASSSSSLSWANPALSSMSVLELERSKAKLLSMVEEVDRRYRRYLGQMRSVELSFEAAAGAGAARAYSELAMRAMSRHFRCLRDAIVAQIRAARRAAGGKGAAEAAAAAVPGATKGETPRLRVLDQRLRQHRAFRHGGAAADSFPWRPQRGLPERAVAILRAWLFEHFLHPYPSDVDKHLLARQTGLSRSQVSNWFINARVRLWKPMIEDMYTEETNQQHQEPEGCAHPSHGDAQNPNPTSNNAVLYSHDQKPPPPGEEAAGHLPDNSFISAVFDGGHQLAGYTSMPGGGGAVLLTLGLQQHAGGGGGGAPVHFGMLDVREEEEMLPYRNLMGSHQFLHDDLA